MKNCLPKETIKILSDRRLRGTNRVETLKHLERCTECRAHVRMPAKKEISRRLEQETEAPSPLDSTGNESSDSPADKEFEKDFQKLLDKLRGDQKTKFRMANKHFVFSLFLSFHL